MLLDRRLYFDGCEQKEQGKGDYTRVNIYLCITGPSSVQGTHGALCSRENVSIVMTSYPVPFCPALKAMQPKHDCHFKYVNFYVLFKFHLKLEMKLKMLSSK